LVLTAATRRPRARAVPAALPTLAAPAAACRSRCVSSRRRALPGAPAEAGAGGSTKPPVALARSRQREGEGALWPDINNRSALTLPPNRRQRAPQPVRSAAGGEGGDEGEAAGPPWALVAVGTVLASGIGASRIPPHPWLPCTAAPRDCRVSRAAPRKRLARAFSPRLQLLFAPLLARL